MMCSDHNYYNNYYSPPHIHSTAHDLVALTLLIKCSYHYNYVPMTPPLPSPPVPSPPHTHSTAHDSVQVPPIQSRQEALQRQRGDDPLTINTYSLGFLITSPTTLLYNQLQDRCFNICVSLRQRYCVIMYVGQHMQCAAGSKQLCVQ